MSGDVIRYVVNRNINYTNICYFRCRFCAFSKGRTHEDLRGAPYDLALEEVARRARRGWERGATEVCLQGGIHPDYTGETYRSDLPRHQGGGAGMHIHAFSPLEVTQGAATLQSSRSMRSWRGLKEAGLGTLPGTAAEILDDEVRAIICPDKMNTGAMARRAARRAQARPAHDLDHHVRPCRDARSPGRAICWRCATCRSRPAASPSSCRCRSCTWKRRCTARAWPAAVRPSARR